MVFLVDEVFAGVFIFKHCLKLKPVKWAPPNTFWKEKISKKSASSAPLVLKFPDSHPIFRKTLVDYGDKLVVLYLGNKQNAPQKSFRRRRSSSSSSRKRSASNSNQSSSNTQTLPTLTLFLPLHVHGSWLFFLQSSHWKSGTQKRKDRNTHSVSVTYATRRIAQTNQLSPKLSKF